MIYYLLLVASIILAVCKSSLYNAYAQKTESSQGSTFRFYAISYGVASVIALIGLFVSAETISFTTVLCAFFYAIIVISLQTISITAMRVGAMSTTSICVMYGMIIPSIAGPIFWQETIGVLQIVGIIMMIVSLYLIKGKSRRRKKHLKKMDGFGNFCIFSIRYGRSNGKNSSKHRCKLGENVVRIYCLCVYVRFFVRRITNHAQKRRRTNDATCFRSFGRIRSCYRTLLNC